MVELALLEGSVELLHQLFLCVQRECEARI